MRSHTDIQDGRTGSNTEDNGQDILENLLDSHMQRVKVQKNEDILDKVQFFKNIKDAKDRRNLKESLNEETFNPGDVIFNYGKQLGGF